MSCSICYERFVAPVSLPCGHIFCRECIRRTVDSIKSCSVQHYCPTCRKPFCVVSIDPELVPPYLRPHIQSPIRPLFFDESVHSPSTSASASTSSSSQSQSQPTTSPTSPPLTNPSPFTASPTSASAPPPTTPSPIPIPISSPTPADLGRVTAAADALRLSCLTWRKRAEVHAAANAGLLGFARAAKESAQRMRVERDAARNECLLLKRKLAEVMAPPEWSDSDADSPLEGERPERMVGRAPAPRGLPGVPRAAEEVQGRCRVPAVRRDDAESVWAAD
ncbi:RING-type domain-containing protein [Mycena venus]|uniref:RING-type domain-containing protein n=1 Tax=Mycena venus TaxID=2733690 RepID=A0A8H6Y9J2_9AGAR|nr:RING-type domain-containing protein [Mycena venus]